MLNLKLNILNSVLGAGELLTFETGGAAGALEHDRIDARRNVARDPFETARASADWIATAFNAWISAVGPRTT